MKFVRIATSDTQVRLAVVDGEYYRAVAGYDDLLPLLNQGESALHKAGMIALESGEVITGADARLLSPIATPPTFRDFYAFEQHAKAGRNWRGLEMDPVWYEIPVFYFSNPYAFQGEGAVEIAPGAHNFDVELEAAAVVGKRGKNLTAEEGEDAVVGYCILNDWSGRDIQHREMKLSLGPVKGKDTVTSLGPWFVTKDELEPYRTETGFGREMTLSINGRQYARANWKDVYFSFGEMVAYASRGTEVRPGDVIGTGCILELSRTHDEETYPWLAPGDEVIASIAGLGEQRSRVVAGADLVNFRRTSAE